MKNKTIIVFISITLFLASNQVFAQETEQQTEVSTTYIKMSVDGLACPFCAYGLEKRIKKMKVSKDIFIEINEGYVTFNVPYDKSPTEAELTKIVKEAGFKAREIIFANEPFKQTKNEK